MATLEDITDEFFLGEDWIFQFTLNDESGDVLDLTSGEIEFRLQKGSIEKEYSYSNDDITMTDPTLGVAVLVIRPADQDDFAKGTWNYELWCQLADTTSSIQAKGTLTIANSLKVSYP